MFTQKIRSHLLKTISTKQSEGFENVIGVDYCDEAVKLASKIAEQRNVQNIVFILFDIITDVSTF